MRRFIKHETRPPSTVALVWNMANTGGLLVFGAVCLAQRLGIL